MNREELPSSLEAGGPRFYYGYVIVLASVLATMIMCGAQFSFGVFFKPLLADFGWTREATSGIYTTYMLVQGVSAVAAGRLSERYGPRLVITVCGLLLGTGYILVSQISALWQIYLFYGVIAGMGGGCYIPIVSTVARWFGKRGGMMTGIVASGIGAGTLIMPPLATQLIASFEWRASYLIIGCASLVIVVSAAQVFRERPDGSRKNASSHTVEASLRGGLSLGQALRTKQLWTIVLAFSSTTLCVNTVMIHIVPYATDIGISPARAAFIISLIGGLSILGKVAAGSAADRISNRWLILIMMGLMIAGFFWLRAATEMWMLYLFAVVFSIAYSGTSALSSPAVASFFGLKAHGSILGLVFFSQMIGGGFGPLLAGRIFDATGSYESAFLIDALLVAAALTGSLLLLKPVRRLKNNDA